MKRIDIVVNQALEEEVVELLEHLGYGEEFTYMHPVYGRGGSGRREGSAVWPQINSLFIVYMDDDTVAAAGTALDELKQSFPKEGIRYWSIPS